MFLIRNATKEDLPSINEIYNQAVVTTTATFDTNPQTIRERKKWYQNHEGKYPVLIAEENDRVLGWTSLSRYSERPAYSITAEISIYIHPRYQRQGVGRELTEKIIEEGRLMDLHTILARISTDNIVSIRLAESLGFKPVGVMKEVGQKFGRLLDVVILQLIFH
jgi:L-amino acid N-acyltransferase